MAAPTSNTSGAKSRRIQLIELAQEQYLAGNMTAAKQSAQRALACVGRKNPQLRASMRAWHKNFLQKLEGKPLFPHRAGGMAILPDGPDTHPL